MDLGNHEGELTRPQKERKILEQIHEHAQAIENNVLASFPNAKSLNCTWQKKGWELEDGVRVHLYIVEQYHRSWELPSSLPIITLEAHDLRPRYSKKWEFNPEKLSILDRIFARARERIVATKEENERRANDEQRRDENNQKEKEELDGLFFPSDARVYRNQTGTYRVEINTFMTLEEVQKLSAFFQSLISG